MNKTYDHKEHEDKIYKLWEDNKAFSPEGVSKLREKDNLSGNSEPYSVLMPPPNANAALHCGHATYSIQDLMIRYKRMQGFDSVYFPGTDHAGFETQVVYERKLKAEGKSRFDYDRKTFFNDVLNFVKDNGTIAINQLKKIGMSADWSRLNFTLEPKSIDTVYDTFIKLNTDGLVYRSGYMVNYSTYHGTTFSDLETEYKDSVSPLYYVKYQIKDSTDYIVVATVRPETIYADVAIAVNPNDSRYSGFVGKKAINPLNGRELDIISDEYVDTEFGTGALKITPGHDANDFEIGKKNNLPIITVINLSGHMQNTEAGIDGLFPKQARAKVADILAQKEALEKIDEKYENRVLVDYKDGFPIEPLVIPNWFIKTETLFEPVINAVKNEDVKFNKKIWKNEVLRWLEQKRPWPISRQIVFGIQIPAWYSVKENPNVFVSFVNSKKETVSGTVADLLNDYSIEEIKNGIQKVIAPENSTFIISKTAPSDEYLQDTDTFDTWFSSGQWPFTTTNFPNGDDYKKYFPTSFLDSMWDIIFFWIARMLMFSLYLTKDSSGGAKIPFKSVYFHGAITDKHGKKMSKSKGNVINPMDFVEKYGADALRMGIMVGGDTSARMSPLDEDKVKGYRNFANKIWNIGRYFISDSERSSIKLENLDFSLSLKSKNSDDTEILSKLNTLIESTTNYLDNYKYKYAGDALYSFIWEDFANSYLESIKNRQDKEIALGVAVYVYMTLLKLLHPYMPFVTESIWQEMALGKLKVAGNGSLIIFSSWPNANV